MDYTYTRHQDAAPLLVENIFMQVRASASNAIVRQRQACGGKFIARSKPVPIKHVIASPALSREMVDKLRDHFVALDSTEAGRKKLEPIRIQGYAAAGGAALLNLGAWPGLWNDGRTATAPAANATAQAPAAAAPAATRTAGL